MQCSSVPKFFARPANKRHVITSSYIVVTSWNVLEVPLLQKVCLSRCSARAFDLKMTDPF